MRASRLLLVVLLAAGFSMTGCKSLSLNDLPWPSQLGWLKNFLAEREEVAYYPTARENFAKAMDLYVKEEWEDAGKYFDYVKTKFPHSRYAVIAELRLADAHFGREKWLDSIDAYRGFIRLHPTHDGVAYATFQIAKAYYRQIPEEWFFLPPVSERDQSAALDAIRAFDDFLIRFPDHERAAEARTLRKEARSRLASHEWYVAGYYERQHGKGAAFRYERIADMYPDVDYAAEGLMNAAEIWEDAKDWRRALVDYERVARDYPKSKFATKAAGKVKAIKQRLEGLETPKPKAAPPKPAPETPAQPAVETPAEEEPATTETPAAADEQGGEAETDDEAEDAPAEP